MRPVLTAAEMRAVDAHLIDSGVPGIVLMENAGRGAAHLIGLRDRPRFAQASGAGEGAPPERALGGSCVRCADERALAGVRVAVVSGIGNNGGDGSVVARHLLARGASVELFLVVGEEGLSGDAALALSALRAVGGRIHDARTLELSSELPRFGLVVDAILGTGANRAAEGAVERAILAVNASERPVIALDVPSGLDATTGAELGACVQAEHTISFGFLKTGLLTTSGFRAGGRITLSNLGVPAVLPPTVEPKAFLLEVADVRAALSPRDPGLHKVQAGHVVVVGGSPGMTGAPNLTGRAALRAGAGLVTVVLAPEVVWGAAGELPALMTKSTPSPFSAEVRELCSRADVMVVGPGLGRSADAEARLRAALALGRPTVLDADGLRLVARDGALRGGVRLSQHPALILTPHAGEAADLLGTTSEEVERDRFAAARQLASESNAIVLLKGPRTLIAEPDGRVIVSAFGTPALATAGSGDVLAGVVAALWASEGKAQRGQGRLEAAWLGAALHGLTAERWSTSGGDRGLVATDLIDGLPSVRAGLS